MKKKIIVILIICLFLGLSIFILFLDKYNSGTQVDNNEIVYEETDSKKENIIEDNQLKEEIEFPIGNATEQIESVATPKEEDEIQKDNDKINDKKSEDKTQIINKNTTSTSTTQKEENKEITKNVENSKNENKESLSNNEVTNKTEQKEEKDNTPKCNHSNEGYYNTEDEAKAYYKELSKEFGKKVKDGEITYEEYLKKCPYGCETMSCQYCGKWTISLYYE